MQRRFSAFREVEKAGQLAARSGASHLLTKGGSFVIPQTNELPHMVFRYYSKGYPIMIAAHKTLARRSIEQTTQAAARYTKWTRAGSLHKLDSACGLPTVLPIFELDSTDNVHADFPRKIHIGRHSKQNLVVLPDTRISREHAMLVQKNDCLYLRDNGSTLGTYLNGKRLYYGEELLIRHNDLIGFGPVLYEFRQEDQLERCAAEPVLRFDVRAARVDGRLAQLLQVVPMQAAQDKAAQDKAASSRADPAAVLPETDGQNESRRLRSAPKSPYATPFATLISHNTKLQFLGYTIGNVILAVDQFLREGTFGYALNLESIATLVLLLGSICAWQYSPTTRPYMLFCNGLLILLGGILFSLAGYHATGVAMLLASLEATRGGLIKLCTLNQNQIQQGQTPSNWAILWQVWGTALFGWYVTLVSQLTSRYQHVGRFLDEHPFLISPAIQMPARVLFIGAMILNANWAGVLVGILWVVGDFGLALNDSHLKSRVMSALLHKGGSTRLAHAASLAQ